MDEIIKAIKFVSDACDPLTTCLKDSYTVGMILKNYGYCDGIVAAGILSFLPIDSESTFEEIKKDFGIGVSNILLSVCEDIGIESQTDRKTNLLQKVRDSELMGKIVMGSKALYELQKSVSDEMNLSEFDKWYYRSLYESISFNFTFKPSMLDKYQNVFYSIFGENLED